MFRWLSLILCVMNKNSRKTDSGKRSPWVTEDMHVHSAFLECFVCHLTLPTCESCFLRSWEFTNLISWKLQVYQDHLTDFLNEHVFLLYEKKCFKIKSKTCFSRLKANAPKWLSLEDGLWTIFISFITRKKKKRQLIKNKNVNTET